MYKPASKKTWKGRIDVNEAELGLRWHQAIHFLDLSVAVQQVPDGEVAFCFLGFCCDEGVRRNQGRTGAVGGPDALRGAMASFAHHLPSHVKLFDGGDVFCPNQNLEAAQEHLGKKITLLLQQGYHPLVLGGGHEVAYGQFLGLEKATAQRRLGILNFDAHFDLRSYAQQASSGTPFLQIASKLQEQKRSFIYRCLGIQEQANTSSLFLTAERLGVTYMAAEQMHNNSLNNLKKHLQEWLEQVDVVYTTIDLDVFASAYAPGVSAVNALGLTPGIVRPLLQQVVQSGKLLSLDVAELNPAYDTDNHTAKLGAALLYHIVKDWKDI
jgi:formiminoglutamase